MNPKLERIRSQLREAWPAAQQLLRERDLIIEWLKSARRAQIALALVVVLGVTIVPIFREGLLDVVSPEKSGFFIGRRKESDARRALRSIWNTVYWLGGFGAVGALLVLHAPSVRGRRRELDASLSLGGPSPGPAPNGPPATAEEATVYASSVDAGASNTGAPFIGEPASGGTPDRPGGRYAIEGELGRGGMGVVYRAYDPVLDRTVALKELPPTLLRNADLAARFRNEARVLAKLMHPGIVQVFDLVEDRAGMWMAIEIVTGGSLDEMLEERGRLPTDEVLRLGVEMAEAMDYAHTQGVVHRDFKPHNVLLNEQGRPKITDFGLAKLAQGPSLTQEGAVMGSPSYMSPEQAAGDPADARSDIYSLGITLYQMLSGRTPFQGPTSSVLMQQITQPPPALSELVEVSAELEAFLHRMLAKEPGDRPATMHEVAQSLAALR